jgi:hypothetical protein
MLRIRPERKRCFFEKKQQKTFLIWVGNLGPAAGWRRVRIWMAGPRFAHPPCGTHAPVSRSFLLLFFKKEALALVCLR